MPALEAAGCERFRADKQVSAGDIRTDMFFELVTADYVVADLSIANPNVYYELGIREVQVDSLDEVLFTRQRRSSPRRLVRLCIRHQYRRNHC